MKHIKSLEVIITSLLILCLINACSKSKTSTIIAEIDNKPIYEDELNTIIKQELFDELNRISELKKKALEQLINVKLVQDEANKMECLIKILSIIIQIERLIYTESTHY